MNIENRWSGSQRQLFGQASQSGAQRQVICQARGEVQAGEESVVQRVLLKARVVDAGESGFGSTGLEGIFAEGDTAARAGQGLVAAPRRRADR